MASDAPTWCPCSLSAIGKQRIKPEAIAVAVVTTMGYAGILLGPAVIGFLAQVTCLSTAFPVLAASLVGVATCARALNSMGRDPA